MSRLACPICGRSLLSPNDRCSGPPWAPNPRSGGHPLDIKPIVVATAREAA